MSLLICTPVSEESWDYDVTDQGTHMARIDTSWLGEAATIEVGELQLHVDRQGWFTEQFPLVTEDGEVVAQARRPSGFAQAYEVEAPGYVLDLASDGSRGYRVEGPTGEIGTIEPSYEGSRRLYVQLPAEMPISVRVFLAWIVLRSWREEEEEGA